MQPPVVAVIPCHNHAGWVNDAIDSLDQQDYPHKVIVVVDDGSTDKSVEAIAGRLYKPRQGSVEGLVGSPSIISGKTLHNQTDVMVICYPEGHGPSFARNRGIEVGLALKGEIFALLDSDDMYQPGKLAKSVAKIVSAPAIIGAVYTDYDTLRADGLRLRQWKEPFSRTRLLRECIVNCDSVVSRKAIEATGLFDEGLRACEDYDWWLRLSEHFLISHLAESLVTIRVGLHSSTATLPAETWKTCYSRVFEKVRQRAGG